MKLGLLKILRTFHLINKEKYNEKRQIEIIKNSPLFDAEWYKSTYSEIDFSNITPVKHFLIYGKKELRNPSKKFDTIYYLEQNPDVAEQNINPLIHYERFGKQEGRYPEIKQSFNPYTSYGKFYAFLRSFFRFIYQKKIKQNQNARILVHLHLYYINAWIEIKEYLENLSCYPFELIVTYIKTEDISELTEEIKSFHSNTRFYPIENNGFDIGPFIEILNRVNLDNYDIVYHLHSKSIASKKGRLTYNRLFIYKSWFHQLYSGCLGVFNTHLGIDILMKKNNYGQIAAKNLIFTDELYRQKIVQEYASRLNVPTHPNYKFVGGSCFGIRAHLLQKIKDLKLTIESFDTSKRYIFTLAHAMERIFSILTYNQRYKIYPMHTLYNNHPVKVFKTKLFQKYTLNPIIKQLQKDGITNISPLKLDIKSGLKCTFLTGKYNNKPVFIKYGGIPEIVENEFKKQQTIYTLMPDHTPKAFTYNLNPPYIISEYLNGYNLEELLNFGITPNEKQEIILQLIKIKDTLLKTKYLHRDIRPANLIFSNNQLYLIDFQFTIKKRANNTLKELNYIKKHPNITKSLGDIYRDPERWNDTYSINKVIEDISNT